jgi:hypothetical protein
MYFFYSVARCIIHENFFDWNCNDCKEEYKDLKGTNSTDEKSQIKVMYDNNKADKGSSNYKEFTEERAKKLYEEVFLQYLKKGNMSEEESIEQSKRIIRKQCSLRNIEPWSWV